MKVGGLRTSRNINMSMFAFCDFPRITCSRTMYLCVLPFFEFCQFVRFVVLYLCHFLEDRCLSFCDSYKIANGHNMQFGRVPYLGKTWFLEIVFWVVECSVNFNFSKSRFSDFVIFQHRKCTHMQFSNNVPEIYDFSKSWVWGFATSRKIRNSEILIYGLCVFF